MEEAERLIDEDPARASTLVQQAAEAGAASAQLLTRAAALLQQVGEQGAAHTLLEQAVTFDTPPAPTQLALAESFRARGDRDQAARWLRGAIRRARPDAALLLELAALDPAHADELAHAARSFRCRDTARAIAAGDALLAAGERLAARRCYDIAFGAQARDADFLFRYSALLADTAMHADLPPGPIGMPYEWNVASAAAQARLAQLYPRESLLMHVRAREAEANWLDAPAVSRLIRQKIDDREPFSWIRLNDGEARFVMHVHPELRQSVPDRDAHGMASLIWYVWFGQSLDQVPTDQLTLLDARLTAAIRNADLLGLISSERILSEQLHYGFCAALEHHVTALLRDVPAPLFTEAGTNLVVNAADPFLRSLLAGLDFLGVISPHPELAGRLQRALEIGAIASYDIPGEGRLERPREQTDRGLHFPARFEQLLENIEVPRPGAVFLVAGGLLGKIYCDAIKRKGGIALDIGALADAWMGHNTRGAALDETLRHQLPI